MLIVTMLAIENFGCRPNVGYFSSVACHGIGARNAIELFLKFLEMLQGYYD